MRGKATRRRASPPRETEDICANCGADTSLMEGGVKVGKDWLCINATACMTRANAKKFWEGRKEHG